MNQMENTLDLQERFEDICKRAGLKLTHQRMEIYNELAHRQDHPSAEAIHAAIKGNLPYIALDTVYRTLKTLESIQAIRRLDVFDDQARFDANMTPHHHCICSRCKAIVDFRWETFDVLEAPGVVTDWGQTWSKSVVLRGVCRNCLNQGAGRVRH